MMCAALVVVAYIIGFFIGIGWTLSQVKEGSHFGGRA